MVFRVAGLCAAITTALLIAAAGAQGPQAKEGALSQDQATGSKQTMLDKIGFTSTRDHPLGEIYLMDPDDPHNPQRLTENTDGDGFPAFPPNGKSIVFDSQRCRTDTEPCPPGDKAAAGDDLYVMNTDGTEQTYVTPGSSASWDPYSKNIAYHASAEGTKPQIFVGPGAPTTDSDIFVTNVDDSIENKAEPIKLTDNGAATIDDDADWLPNGDQILFTSFDPVAEAATRCDFASAQTGLPKNGGGDVQTREIYVMDLTRNTHGNITGASAPKNLSNTNDVQNTSYTTTDPCKNQDGAPVTSLPVFGLEERAPAWSADGSKIAFSCRRPSDANGFSNSFEICVMDVDRDDPNDPNKITGTSNEVVLTHNNRPDFAGGWTSDGGILLHRSLLPGLDNQPDNQLFVINAAGTESPLTGPKATEGQNLFPKWGKLRIHD